MGSGSWSGRRIGGFAGIGFVVLFIVMIAIGIDGPTYDDTASEVREFFVDSDTRVHLVTWLGGLIFVFFFLPFAAGLRTLLASAEGPDDPVWSRLSYTGAVVAVAIGGVGSAFWEVLSQGTAEELPDESLVALARFDTVIFIGILPWALALFVAAASVAVIRTKVLAVWIGWVGALAALLLVVGSLWIFAEDDEAALSALGFIGLPLTVLWILAISIVMLRGSRRETVPEATV